MVSLGNFCCVTGNYQLSWRCGATTQESNRSGLVYARRVRIGSNVGPSLRRCTVKESVRWCVKAAAMAIVIGSTLGGGAAMAEDKPVRWKVQSWFPTKLPHVGTQITDISKKVKAVSGGSIQFQVFEPGALIPPAECFDAVSNGAVNACWGISGYYYGKNPALAIFSAVPFGPEWPEMLAYFYYGGGKEQYDEIYAKSNIKGIVCGGTVSEASGWFRKEINSVDDLKGMKMRIFGLGAK